MSADRENPQGNCAAIDLISKFEAIKTDIEWLKDMYSKLDNKIDNVNASFSNRLECVEKKLWKAVWAIVGTAITFIAAAVAQIILKLIGAG